MRYFDFVKQICKGELFKSSGIYLFSRVLNSCIPLLLLSIMTAKLSPSEYGIISMFNAFISFCIPIVTFNLDAAIARKYYSTNNISSYLGNCSIISFCSFIITESLFLLFVKQLHYYTGISTVFILLIPVDCFACFFCNSILVLWQVRKKPIYFGCFQISRSIIEASISILLVVFLLLNWKGRAVSIVFTNIIFACVAIVLLLKNKMISLSIDKTMICHALKFGGGLIPHAIGANLIVLTSRLFLTNMVSVEETGLYAVGYQIGGVLSFITISFNYAFVPWLYGKLSIGDEQNKRKIVKLTYLYYCLLTVLGVFLYLVMPVFFRFLVDKKFHEAISYVPWIILGSIFQGCYFMVTNYISFAEKTHILAMITIFVGLISIPVNYFLIKFMGGIGAAVAYSLIFLLQFVFTWFISARIYKMPWSLKNDL